jgi:hypothetical protein
MYLIGCQYRKKITISGSAGAGTNFQVKLLIGETSGATGEDFDLNGHSLTFPSAGVSGDLRFTASDGTTPLPFWVESVSGTTPNRLVTVRVKVADSLETNKDIYCYYGRASAPNVCDGNRTFLFFDNNEYYGYTDTKLADSQGSPEGFVLIDGYFYQAEQDTETRIHQIDPSDGSATGEYFDFDSSDASHTSSLCWDGEYLWAVDYDTDKVLKVDLDASLTSHSAVIVGEFDVGDGVVFSGHPSAMAFVNYNGTRQLLITEWADDGDMIVVDFANALIDGTADGNVLRTFNQCSDGDDPGRIQGIYTTSDDNYASWLILAQNREVGGGSITSTNLRWYDFGDLYDISASTVLTSEDYYRDNRVFLSTDFIGQQPSVYDGDIYFPEETNDDIRYLSEAQISLQNSNWSTVSGSLFSTSTDQAYNGSYSGKLPASSYNELNINQGASVFEVFVYPTDNTDRNYLALCEASDRSDRLTIGVHSTTNWEYWDGSWHDCGIAVAENAWTKITYSADGAGNVKLYINDSQVYSGSRYDENDYFLIQNPSGYGANPMYWDCAFVRKYLATEPSFSSATAESDVTTELETYFAGTITVDDDWLIATNPELASIAGTITVDDSWSIATVINADYGYKIISYNPLVYVTNSDPAYIVSVDVSTPSSPVQDAYEIVGASYAIDVILNDESDYFYVVCGSGKIAKIEKANLSNQTIINTGDSDNSQNIAVNEHLGLTWVSTDDSDGELILIDERETFIGDMRLDVLSTQKVYGDFEFYCINTDGQTMDTDFRALAYVNTTMQCDFRCLTSEIDNVTPIGLTDFVVFINDTQLEVYDVDLSSISITHTIDNLSTATFRLNRKHDQLDTDLESVSSQITNSNAVKITIDGNIEFNGYISELDCRYDVDGEYVVVTAEMEQPTPNYETVTVSLPSLNSRLGLYDVMVQNPRIKRYPIYNTDAPLKYKGIRCPLGLRVVENVSRYLVYDSTGSIADDITDGSFVPRQNWTYFWSPTVTKFGNFTLGQTSSVTFDYIGTSLSPVSDDLWKLDNAKHRRQRQFDDKTSRVGTTGVITEADITELGLGIASATLFSDLQSAGYINGSGTIQNAFILNIFDAEDMNINRSTSIKNALYELLDTSVGYYLGTAPYKTINPRNGIFVADDTYVDNDNGLYLTRAESYNFEDYCKKVADLEYEKLKNINGDIEPDTSCTMNLTVDAYYFYDLALLKRINVDNTTTTNIYKNNNGFPVSIKSITIDASTRQVTLSTDNQMSNTELEDLDGQFPNEDDYIEPEKSTLIALKEDMRSRLKVE